jgi:NRPS condensation-like uncharacterized protein
MPGINHSETENRWYRLDNAAKIYPAVTNTRTNIFRVAVRLKEQVNAQKLQEALEQTLPRFPSFNVRMQKGLFWYFFEHNPGKPIVYIEKAPVCRPINLQETNGYLFRVSHYHRRISLEVFHAVADGTGAITFLKSLLYRYLMLLGKDITADDEILEGIGCPAVSEVEDSFLKYYDPKISGGRAEEKAYQITGTRSAPEEVRVIHGILPVDAFKQLARESGATITEYTAALIIYSIWSTQLKGRTSRLPVKVSVPVNLRNIFASQTVRNFSSYVNVGLAFDSGTYVLEDILKTVSGQIKDSVQKDKLVEKIGANVKSERSPFVRFAPLFVKGIALRTAYNLYGERLVTTTLSNLGVVSLPESMSEYVERFDFVLGAPDKNTHRCAMCTFGGSVTVSFTRIIEETEIERFFFRYLAEKGLDIVIESNDGSSP